MTFQEIILELHKFWSNYGCVIFQPYDIEKGAGTMNPATFLRVLDSNPWKAAYVEPSRRPTDGRFGENPNRLQHYYQYQIIIKPAPKDIQDVYLKSLKVFKINPRKHEIRFVEDDWESPTLGAAGIGWEVWVDGLEITQFTYFQQAGGIELNPISVEITYGLERIATFVQNKSNIFDIEWSKIRRSRRGNKDLSELSHRGIKYADIHLRDEIEFSKYNFEKANIEMLFKLFDMYEKEADSLIDVFLALPAYDYVLKCSHIFNLLDSRGAISVTERISFIARVRNLSRKCCLCYLKKYEKK